jgi:hypothetical protein
MPLNPSKTLKRKNATFPPRRTLRARTEVGCPDASEPGQQKTFTRSYQKNAEPPNTSCVYLGTRISTATPLCSTATPDQRKTEKMQRRAAAKRKFRTCLSPPPPTSLTPQFRTTQLSVHPNSCSTPFCIRRPRLATPDNSRLLENLYSAHAARFSHQIRLVTRPGERTPPVLMGMALAAAGRSTALHYNNLLLLESIHWRPQMIAELRSQWAKIASTFASLDLPSQQVMAQLWSCVYQIMKIHVLNAEMPQSKTCLRCTDDQTTTMQNPIICTPANLPLRL